MITALLTIGGVAVLCGSGYAITTAFDWMDNVKVEPISTKIKLGKERKSGKEGSNHDNIANLRKEIRSEA